MSIPIKEVVKDKYGSVARSEANRDHEGARRIAEAFGYSADELSGIPAEANLGLSCGNPTALAGLKLGEVVLDLGCGGGIDVLLAAQKVGSRGKAIGIDMTADMIARARRNAEKSGLKNVEFHLAEIEKLPLPNDFVDCVISNCVLNLVPDKECAFAEIFRVLKPGGRLAATDIALKKPLPRDLADDLNAYVGCVAGAILMTEYEQKLRSAGFRDVEIIDIGADLNAYSEMDGQVACCAPAVVDIGIEGSSTGTGCCASASEADLYDRLKDLLRRYDVNEFAASAKVLAIKPGKN
jgi:SAM-dependent methyltransferase